MSFRNRCQVAGAEGLINLSIPLQKGRDQKTLVKNVRIADRDDWQSRHWKTIVSCYSRSPWFEFYRDGLDELYRKPFHFLLDWNLACFEWSLTILQMPVSFSLTTAYHKSYAPLDWTDWRGKILPKNRTAGERSIGNPDQFNRGESDPSIGITGIFDQTGPHTITPNHDAPVKYRQVFEERTGFLPNLSILDLLFCEGKNARALLQQDASETVEGRP